MGGFSTLSLAQIIEPPHSGTAATGNDGTIRFQPKTGFTGNDSMTVRYTGTGGGGGGGGWGRRAGVEGGGLKVGVPRQATVSFSITVY